ncbi:MAG: CHAT domain-containing tetratricopeptide repeat protein [Saprospiraceae bacterium]|nr:CHAT domain-containing tetratricopeptide repeat protein [Saprospiraceae bacterium]
MKIIFLFLLVLAPIWAMGQQTPSSAQDTSAIRLVDSLLAVCSERINQKDYDQAAAINASARQIVEEKLGYSTAWYADICHNEGIILAVKKDFSGAEKAYLESLEIREKVSGKDHPGYLYSLQALTTIYWRKGDFEQAERISLQALLVLDKSSRNTDEDRIYFLNTLGNTYHYLGNYEKSEYFHLECLALRGKVFGKQSVQYAYSLGNLAGLYNKMGLFEKAEQYAALSQIIMKQELGANHPDYARILTIQASFNFALGNYKKAEYLYLESINVWQKGPNYTDQQNYWNNKLKLAMLYRDIGKYEQAENLFAETQNYFENKKSDNPLLMYPTCIIERAELYTILKKFEKAESLFLEGKAVGAKVLGKDHPDYVYILIDIARFYMKKGDLAAVLPLCLEANDIIEKSLGKHHDLYYGSLKVLAKYYELENNFSAADPLWSTILSADQERLYQSASLLTERELTNYTLFFQSNGNSILSALHRRMVGNKQIAILPALCYDHALFQKGFLLNNAQRVNKLAKSSSEGADLLNELNALHRRLSAEYTKPNLQRDSLKLAALEDNANAIEKDLIQKVKGYRDAIRQIKWQDVQQALKPGAAAIEFVSYQYQLNEPTDSTLYGALILKADGPPVYISLFNEKELTTLLKGATGGNNFLKINALYAQKTANSKQKSLYELIWQPLETALKGSKTVYFAPAGLLHRINLAAILNTNGKPFGDNHSLVLLGSTRQLVAPTANTNLSKEAYLAGGIRYDADSTTLALANRNVHLRGIEGAFTLPFQPDSTSITRGGVLEYLPASAAEVREIGQTLQTAGIQAKVDTGFYATETSFRQLGVGAPAPRILHLATHGYFFPDPVQKDQKSLGGLGQEPVFKMSEHPMIRSGLIMAGAKQTWLTGKHPEGQEDGILTAYEISQMNLEGTELVVLSACETGLGDIIGKEGVFGLQRAFKIAGAKYLIMSLWKVDDQSTKDFMTTFYKHWLIDHQTVPEAFQTTQRAMRGKRSGAFDWAGFVLIE